MRSITSVIYLSLVLAVLTLSTAVRAQVICISNASPPPELPVYDQPPLPGQGYIWTPGYWGSGPYGYFWVPGTWVLPPAIGLLWTPGYWAWRDGIYVWNAGYWGAQVGFYGGIDYGFGYAGIGYEGGRWDHGVFAYNRAVNNFGAVSITNVYEKSVVVDPAATRVSFNGGSGGTRAEPTPEQQAIAREPHTAAIAAQLQHERTASADKSLLASENHGRPAIAATIKPGEFTGKGVVAAREEKGPVTPPQQEKPGGAAVVAPNAHAPDVHEERRPVGHEQAPPQGVPPKEVNREVKPPAPAVQSHPEVKPPPPPPAAHPQAAPHVATTPKPPPPPPPHPTPPPKDKNKKPPE